MKATRVIATTAAALAAVAGGVWIWRNQGDLASGRPFNEWAFTHMDRILPTETVNRPRAARPFVQGPTTPAPQALSDLRYEFGGRSNSIEDLHRHTNSTSLLVLHRGQIVHEEYPGWFAKRGTRFQAFSLSKSVTSIMLGMALERGEIGSIDDPVVRYCPQLEGSAYDGPTIAHLLDMMSGVGGPEDWTDPDAIIYRYQNAVTTGGSVLDVLRSAPKVTEPGTAFNYSTLDTHVLGWVLEAATGMTIARGASERLWGPIGAENDAFYFLTRAEPRTALGGGSFNASTRDLARIGLLMANDGRVGHTQLVPEEWVRRSRGSENPALTAEALGEDGNGHYGYSNQWWTVADSDGAFTGIGVHGQYVWVDPAAEVVIVKTSAAHLAEDDTRDSEIFTAFRAITERLAGR